jgi:hypothetical protein
MSRRTFCRGANILDIGQEFVTLPTEERWSSLNCNWCCYPAGVTGSLDEGGSIKQKTTMHGDQSDPFPTASILCLPHKDSTYYYV